MEGERPRLSDLLHGDFLPPAPFHRPFLVGAVAAIAGAVVWALVAHHGQVEIGWLAIGIGALIGFGMVKAGGYGKPLMISAALLAAVSIGSGKYVAYQLLTEQVFPDQLYVEQVAEAPVWAAVDQTNDEAVGRFGADHGYDPMPPDEFRQRIGNLLTWLAEDERSVSEWRSRQCANYTFIDHVTLDFSPLDIVFLLIGIAAAGGQVGRRTSELQAVAVEEERQRRMQEAQQAADDRADEEATADDPPSQ